MTRSRLAIVGLGANLPSRVGPPQRTLQAVLADLAEFSVTPVRVSPFYRSEPVECEPGAPDFINAVAILEPPEAMTADALLSALLRLEADYGRERLPDSHSRTLDLDLIAFDDQQWDTPTLVLPHPKAHARRFVLEPLVALLPTYRLAGRGETAQILLENLPQSPTVIRLDSGECL